MPKIIKFASIQSEPVIINNCRPVLELVSENAEVVAEVDVRQEAADEAEKIVAAAKKQAEECINKAIFEAEQLKQQMYEQAKQEGYRDGYAEGVRQGRQQAAEDMATELNEATKQARKILLDAHQQYKQFVIDAEREVIQIAFALAKKILMREIDENPTVVLPIVKAALDKVRDQEHMTIRVSPDDFELLLQAKRDLQMMVGRENAISVLSDHTVSPGGCLIDTPYGTVDASIDTQFEAVKKALEEVMP